MLVWQMHPSLYYSYYESTRQPAAGSYPYKGGIPHGVQAHYFSMAKVFPHSLLPSSSSSSPTLMSSTREIYTIWMKSLVLNGNGCTIFDSKGEIVYRVDNYDCKCSDEVYLMDRGGKALVKVLRKKLRMFGRWEGYQCNDLIVEEKKPWFRVQKASSILKSDQSCRAMVYIGCSKKNSSCYKIDSFENKSAYRIIDMDGRLLAEVKRKETAYGIALGDDVLTLVVEPNVDHLLIMGLVVVYGLINHNL